MQARKLTVIAWLWARTVASPDPYARGMHVPLASSFVLSSKKGKEAIVVPVVESSGYRFRREDERVDAGGIARGQVRHQGGGEGELQLSLVGCTAG